MQSVAITNPGTDYTSTPTLIFSGGGGGGAAALASATADNAVDGGLTKLGTGTLILSGSSTYTGTTTVSAGALAIISGGSIAGGNVSLQAATTLAVSGTGGVRPGGGATLTVDGTTGSPATLILADTGTVSVGPTYIGPARVASVTQSGGAFTTIGNAFYLGNTAGSSGTFTLSGANSVLSTGTNFVGVTGTGLFTQNSGTVTTNGGALILGLHSGGNGTYNLNGGTLQAAANDPAAGVFFSGVNAAAVQAGGAIVDSHGFNVPVVQSLIHDSSLSGMADGGLTKLGDGILALVAVNTFTGLTTINGGTLQADNSLGSATGVGRVTVNSGATLSGSGAVSGPVTSNANGGLLAVTGTTFAPSRLTLGGALTLMPNAGVAALLNGASPGNGTGGGYSELLVGGQATLDDNLTLLLTPGFTPTIGQMFTLIDDTGAAPTLGVFANAPLGLYVDGAGRAFTVNYLANVDSRLLPNDVTLTYLGVNMPEPSAMLPACLGAFAIGLGRKRQNLHHGRAA